MITGYAAKFDSPSENLGGFVEYIRAGAFAKTIQESDIRGLWNHNDDYVLGRNKAGTLRLAEDEVGLAIEIDPPDTTWARDLVVSIERGDVTQMSFAFRTVQDRWTHREGENPDVIRELIEVRLYDVSPVTYPAYEETEVSVRDLIEGRELTDDEKTALRHILDPGTAGMEPPPAGHSIDLLRKRLDLAERI